MAFYSVSFISGFVVGIQHELLDDDNYLIISLGILEVVFIW